MLLIYLYGHMNVANINSLVYLGNRAVMWSEIFEIKEIDLFGRTGTIYTKHGKVSTPTLTPVINPAKSVLEPKEIHEMGFNLLMTNSYIIKQSYGDLALEVGVHGILGVDTPVITDSGAYQLMVYGRVKVEPREIVEYQVKIGSDIGVILDIPTKKETPYSQVKEEVEETLRRAREAVKIERNGMLLVGPVQGGTYLNLVAYSASELSKLPFDVYAVGGPTQIMENYMFRDLVRLVMTARLNLPWSAPLHLFGAGHPMLIPLAVAMGVDTFDSASYVLYARDDRLLTDRGTLRLNELEELPCDCPVCSRITAKELRELPKQERIPLIAKHNLYVILREIKRTRPAIHEGRLWELVEEKARTHPSMMDAFQEFVKYTRFLSKKHPVTRAVPSGIFFYSGMSRYRPEVVRHIERLKHRVQRSKDTLILFQETPQKPFTRFGLIKELLNAYPDMWELGDLVVLSSVFSVIPLELDGVYPLSQYETSSKVFIDAWHELTSDVAWYVLEKEYSIVILVYYDLYEPFINELEHRLKFEGILFGKVKVDDYYQALSNVDELARNIKSMVETLKSFKEKKN